MRDRIPDGRRTWSSVLMCALVACGGAVSAGCSPPLPRGTGNLEVEVFLPQVTIVQALTYRVSGNGIQPITEVVLISGSPTSTSALFVGLPVGPGYTIDISATCSDATISCQASAAATVFTDKTTDLLVPLLCRGPPNGNALVTANVVFCPQISYLAAAPVTTSVGGEIDLAAEALEPDGSTPSFAWTASAGSFSASTSPTSSFTCAAAGAATITLTVSNGSCADQVTVSVTCVPPDP
jgi:hypothetical protein